MQYAPEISGDLSCKSLVIKYFALPSRLKVFSVWFCIEIIQNFRLIFQNKEKRAHTRKNLAVMA